MTLVIWSAILEVCCFCFSTYDIVALFQGKLHNNILTFSYMKTAACLMKPLNKAEFVIYNNEILNYILDFSALYKVTRRIQ